MATAYLVTVSGLQHSLSVLILSVVIYTIVRYGKKRLKVLTMVVVTVFLWSLPILLLLLLLFNVLWQEPVYVDVYYYNAKLSPAVNFFPSLIIVLVEVPAKVISLSIVIAMFVRTRKSVVSNKKDTLKVMTRFLLVMFILNLFSTCLGLFSAVITVVPSPSNWTRSSISVLGTNLFQASRSTNN